MSGAWINTLRVFVFNGANWTCVKKIFFFVQIFLFGYLTFGDSLFNGALSATEVIQSNGWIAVIKKL
jgi:hypothetical protein